MIEYIKGELAELTPIYAVIDCSGVGYLLNISLPAYTRLEGQRNAKLLVHESIREDAHVLYGFIDEQERSLFRLLIGVSGVGANTARTRIGYRNRRCQQAQKCQRDWHKNRSAHNC